MCRDAVTVTDSGQSPSRFLCEIFSLRGAPNGMLHAARIHRQAVELMLANCKALMRLRLQIFSIECLIGRFDLVMRTTKYLNTDVESTRNEKTRIHLVPYGAGALRG